MRNSEGLCKNRKFGNLQLHWEILGFAFLDCARHDDGALPRRLNGELYVFTGNYDLARACDVSNSYESELADIADILDPASNPHLLPDKGVVQLTCVMGSGDVCQASSRSIFGQIPP